MCVMKSCDQATGEQTVPRAADDRPEHALLRGELPDAARGPRRRRRR